MILAHGPGGRLDPRQEQLQRQFALAAKHQKAGRYADAERAWRSVIAIDPRNMPALNNLGRVQQALGRSADAVTTYRAALGLAPKEPLLFANLGNALAEIGRDREAIDTYQQALTLRPGMAELHSNLGALYQRVGDLHRAASCYQEAVKRSPGHAEAHGQLAHILILLGDWQAAFRTAYQWWSLAKTPLAQTLLARCLALVQPDQDDEALRALTKCAFREEWNRPAEFADIAARLVCLRVSIRSDHDGLLPLLIEDDLLAIHLTSTPVSDLELERILTQARRQLLQQLPDSLPSLEFACVLAQQCFLNEYVFDRSADEAGALAVLRTSRPFTPIGLAVLACYQPLSELPDCEHLLQLDWPDPARQLLRQQVAEPLEEAKLRRSVPQVTPIEEVSQAVGAQYEENPYPRWTRLGPASPVENIAELLRMRLSGFPQPQLGRSKGARILIAGCGTGRQPIELARQMPGARVLAVDLSRSSLAYGQRRARELGVTNIEFAQADLLSLAALGRSFDLIQATGVLHHLTDPFAGWRVLIGLLKNGGLMQVGLYSEAARQPVAAARMLIAARGYRPIADDIRRCRQEISTTSDDHFQQLIRSRDFYYLSGCRDLLFHVQEERLSLPQIGEFLDENGLELLGFELDPAIIDSYRRQNPEDRTMKDLAAWHAFEMRYPQTFWGMYQFWIRKRG